MLTAPKHDILHALSSIVDPELGINIVDLGLIYQADYTSNGLVVRFTVTSPSCPVSEVILAEVKAALRKQFPEARSIYVTLTFDPPWTPDRMSEAARRQLGSFGDRSGSRGRVESWSRRLLGRLAWH
jgi:metal-sulfur cluster biosynthetic enzyme